MQAESWQRLLQPNKKRGENTETSETKHNGFVRFCSCHCFGLLRSILRRWLLLLLSLLLLLLLLLVVVMFSRTCWFWLGKMVPFMQSMFNLRRTSRKEFHDSTNDTVTTWNQFWVSKNQNKKRFRNEVWLPKIGLSWRSWRSMNIYRSSGGTWRSTNWCIECQLGVMVRLAWKPPSRGCFLRWFGLSEGGCGLEHWPLYGWGAVDEVQATNVDLHRFE